MDFYPVKFDKIDYLEYITLFAACFPAAKYYSREYLEWLYCENPDGQVVGFDARDGDRLVAHYVCIPARAEIGGQLVKVLLSLNTATHSDYQGRGLFTKLAELTYAAAAEQGYDSVYGVANANSTPGFIRKLKFQLVAPLRAAIGVGALGIDFDKLAALQFRRTWSADALKWRCSSPIRPIISHKKNNHRIFLAPALFGGLCMAAAEIDETHLTENLVSSAGGFESPLRLFIGLIPPSAVHRSFYVDIPDRLRPSPLNLIYRTLSGRFENINSNAVFFNFLDFDAY